MIKDAQEEYYQALENTSQSGDSTHFGEFMLKIILKTVHLQIKNDPVNDALTRAKEIMLLVRQAPQITSLKLS
jgi:Fic family protein